MFESGRRKKIWKAVGLWMEESSFKDELPIFPTFNYSSSEKKLIRVILEVTHKKRLEFIRTEWRVIKQCEAGYTWSDLITLPDVEDEVRSKLGVEMDVWVNQAMPMMLRFKPMSVSLQNRLSLHKALLGSVEVGMAGIEALLVADKEQKSEKGRYAARMRHDKKTHTPDKNLQAIKEIWYEWRIEQDPNLQYATNPEFAEKIHKQYPMFTVRRIEDLCTEWAKEHGYDTKKGRPKR